MAWWVGVIGGGILIYKLILELGLIEQNWQWLAPGERGILRGMIWGDESFLGDGLRESFKNSGLWHLVVVSGSNMMLLSRVVIEVLAPWWGRRRARIVGLGLVWLYAAGVGWQVPVVRALLMVTLIVVAEWWGRRPDSLRVLAVVVAIMWWADGGMWQSVSFWLSMAAYIGVVSAKRGGGWLGEWGRSIWVAAWVAPILALVFDRFGPMMLVTNVLVLPAAEAAVVLGGMGLVLGQVVMLAAYPFLWWIRVVAEWSGGSDWLVTTREVNWLMVAGWYLLLIWWWRRRK